MSAIVNKIPSCSAHSHSNELEYWLTAEGSLTALLEARARQPLRVERIFEGYRLMTVLQKKQLGYQGYQLTRPMVAWVREVLLYGNDKTPWVAAQSLFPLLSLTGSAKQLKYLKNMPIGYALFKRQKKLPNQRQIKHTANGWQRNTVYDWYGRPILISETFLADFFKIER